MKMYYETRKTFVNVVGPELREHEDITTAHKENPQYFYKKRMNLS